MIRKNLKGQSPAKKQGRPAAKTARPKKAYGSASSFGERKQLKSFSEGSGKSEKPNRTSSERTPRAGAGDKPRTYSSKPRTGSDRTPRAGASDKPRTYSSKPRTSFDRAPRAGASDKPRTYSSKPRTSSDRAPREGASDKPRTYSSKPRNYTDTPRGNSENKERSWDANETPRKRSFGSTGPKGKGKFTKKNELKGFRPKVQPSEQGDFRFMKPGSRGKQVAINEDLAKKSEVKSKPRKNNKELVTENALKDGEEVRLNRFISNAGVCSRREADELITAGLVSINGQIATELGMKIKAGDVVRFNGEKLNVEAKVYIILNKPKDAITTSDDPDGRNTVMDLFEGKMRERIYPVGRLDRNTTGVLLLTNDGELANRLMHPKYQIDKVYRATLNKSFKSTDMWNLANNGVELEDGWIKPDAIAQPDAKEKNIIGVEIHSGRNRIIHRMFEHLGYTVDKLDRVLYAGLEKGKLKRGEWRELTDKEIKALKKMVHLK
jgi:23S rRNA pseudouridine2605 synthase